MNDMTPQDFRRVDASTDPLLQPLHTKRLTFKNRMIHAPTTMNMSDPEGHVTSKCTGAYESLAAGGFSAVVVGATCVRRDGLINERMLGMYDDTYVIGQRDLVEVIHNNASLAGIQLFYGGLIPGLGATTPLPPAQGWIPNTVSWGPSTAYPLGNREPLVVPTEVYRSLVEDYAQAARRAREAGYDFVSFHFCHGSLPHVTLSLLSNVDRTDEYADHFLFCEQILERTQELCGKEFPLIPRMCCDENYENGYDIDYFAEHYAPRLHALDIDAMDCTFGSMLPAKDRDPELKSSDVIGGGFYVPNLVTLPSIQQMRQGMIDRDIELPLIGSCNINRPDDMRSMLTDGGAALVGFCRQSLDDPQFPNKITQGREDDIRRSTRTGASLLQGNIFGKGWAGSAQNASFGRDREYRVVRTSRPKKIVVVGGGAGGMEYALTADEIGHTVVLFEQCATLGGVMDWAGNYRHLPNMEQVRYQTDWQQRMVARSAIDVRLGVTADVATILSEGPDVVVVAAGAEAVLPEVAGLDDAMNSGFAMTIDRALDRASPPARADHVVVWGAGEGIELALDLARDGVAVRLIDTPATLTPANYIGSRSRLLLGWLTKAGVTIESGVTVNAVGDGHVEITHADGRAESIATNRLIVTQGRRPRAELVRALQGKGVQVETLGDVRKPRSYGNAIHEAAYLVRQL